MFEKFWNVYSKSKYFKEKLQAYNAAQYNGGLNVRLLQHLTNGKHSNKLIQFLS
jgi:hypothetical protein